MTLERENEMIFSYLKVCYRSRVWENVQVICFKFGEVMHTYIKSVTICVFESVTICDSSWTIKYWLDNYLWLILKNKVLIGYLREMIVKLVDLFLINGWH